MSNEVRCPHCKKLIVEYLRGTARFTCPRCRETVTVNR